MSTDYKVQLQLDLYANTSLFAGDKNTEARYRYSIDYRAFDLPDDLVADIDTLRADYEALFENDHEATRKEQRDFSLRLNALIPRLSAARPDVEFVPEDTLEEHQV
ncbi:MAG: hypothetical protein R3C52_12120 [Hyphomonadaceae bacterium]